MTVEEAKKFFGEKQIVLTLGYFNKNRRDFGKSLITPKKGRYYWYYFNHYEKHIAEQVKQTESWIRLKVVYRRNGISFMRIEGSKNPKFELNVDDESMMFDYLVPEEISLKEFGLNKDLTFVYDDLKGKIKFVD